MADITSEFSEAQYQSFIESCFINDFRGNQEFDIHYFSGVDERTRGYDIRVDTFIPIFLQMKRSDFYFHNSTNTDMLNRRNMLNYTDNPGAYYFHLHVDSETNEYMQHNLLVDLSNDFNYVRYIAPSFINYDFLMKLKYRVDSIYSNIRIESELSFVGGISSWRDHLHFPHSTLIKPHARQTKVNRIHHKYFFNRQRQISFHSEPEPISQSENFQEFINKLNNEFQGKENQNKISLEKIFNLLKGIIIENLNIKSEQPQRNNFIRIANLFIENNILHREFEGLNKIEYSPQNFYVLTNYLDKRFGIRTLLAGERQFNFDEI